MGMGMRIYLDVLFYQKESKSKKKREINPLPD